MWTWDEAKRRSNLAKHGVDFADIERFQWDRADPQTDRRHDYGERREFAYGLIGARLYFVAFTRRAEEIRIISLRKANRREQNEWNNREK